MKLKRKIWYSLTCRNFGYCKGSWYHKDNIPESASYYSSSQIVYNKNKAMKAFENLLKKDPTTSLAMFVRKQKGNVLWYVWEKCDRFNTEKDRMMVDV